MMMTMIAPMMVMTIAIKMMMRFRRNKLMNTFSRRLDFVFINIVIKNVHIHLECHTSLIWFSLLRRTVQPLNNIHL